MRAILAILLLTVASSRFLQEGAPISFEIVEENSCSITRYQAKPEAIVPGGSIEFKMQYQALQAVNIASLDLDVLNNGVSLFTDKVAINKSYAESEKDVTGYTAAIPSFCPAGSWDIMLYLKDDAGSNAAILKAHFDIE